MKVGKAWIRHRALLGYILLVSISVAMLSIHNERDARHIKRLQLQTCERVNIVAENQRRVLQTIVRITAAERTAKSARLRRAAAEELPLLKDALEHSGAMPCVH